MGQWPYLPAVITLLLVGGGCPATVYAVPQTILLTDTEITPKRIVVANQSTVTLRVVNQGAKQHNFVIPAYFVFSHILRPAEETTVSFQATKAGTFPYYSDTPKPGTPEPGLQGELVVQP